MCLYVCKDVTEFYKQNPPVGPFYKVFIRKGNELVTPYMKYRVTGPGLYKAPTVENPIVNGMVGAGAFHARTDKTSLKQDLFWVDQFELGFCLVVEIVVKPEDVIAYGNQNNVAFTRYELSQEQWEKALKATKPATTKDLI